MSDLESIKKRQQEAWAAGDFAMMATALVLVGELLSEAIDIHPGQTALDVATGSGNTALAAARRGAVVVGIDYVPSVLERARERAAAERLRITFQEGDAEHLAFPDASFDIVLSTFGVMFAPDQEQAARELLRVCRPGGKIGLATWTPDSLSGQTFAITARYAPPPPGVRAPVLWGTEERLRELLGDGISALGITKRSAVSRSPSEERWLESRLTYLGPTRKVFEGLDAAGQAAYSRDLLELVRRFNRAEDGTVIASSDYLEVVAVRK